MLVVEDAGSDRLLIDAALTDQLDGNPVIMWADTLHEAVRQLAEEPIDVVLLDLGLPDTTGLATIAALRAADADVPIVVVSGTAGEADQRLAVRLGVDDVISKDQLDERHHPLGHSIRNAVDRPRPEIDRKASPTTIGPGSSIHIGVLDPENRADNQLDRVIAEVADRCGWRLTLSRTTNLEGLSDVSAASGGPDLLIVDVDVTEPRGLATLRQARLRMPQCEIIVASDTHPAVMALAALDLGAADVLLREVMDGLSVERAILFALRRRRRERELSSAADKDALTGLPSRGVVLEHLEASMRNIETGQSDCCTVVFMGLDGMSQVNAQFGHRVGDHVLRVVAGRMTHVARRGDLLAHLGGCEFVLVLDDFDRQRASGVVERLVDAVGSPIAIDADYRVLVGVRAGMASTDMPIEPTELLDAADRDLYQLARQRAVIEGRQLDSGE